MATKFRRGDIVTHSESLLMAEVDGEVLAMSVDQGACYGLNRVGSRIWGLAGEGRSIDGICAQLLQEFDVDAETCRADVLGLLAELEAENLVRIAPAEVPGEDGSS